MDFQPKIKYILPMDASVPFFMTYPEFPCLKKQELPEEKTAWQDFEYLRRTYPALLGKWQRRVEEVLDRMDYEGSMIYDEYPDRISIQGLGEAVARILDGMKVEVGASPAKRQGNEVVTEPDGNAIMMTEQGGDAMVPSKLAKQSVKDDPLREEYLQGLAQVLVCNEIYRRRQQRKQGTNGRIT